MPAMQECSRPCWRAVTVPLRELEHSQLTTTQLIMGLEVQILVFNSFLYKSKTEKINLEDQFELEPNLCGLTDY